MSSGADHQNFGEVIHALQNQIEISGVDQIAGVFQMSRSGRTVTVTLDPDLWILSTDS